MKIPQAHYPSPLGRMQPNPVDLDAIKQSGWQEQHILVVSDCDERLDFIERQLIRRIGERLYGDKSKRGQHG